MPKVVDHQSKREELAEATWRVIRKKGIDGTTTREIAKETGWSKGAFSHYFSNKKELLVFAYKLALSRAIARSRRVESGLTPYKALREMLAAGLPLDAERRKESQIWITFWGCAATDPSMAEVQKEFYDWWRKGMKRLILDGQRSGLFRADLVARDEAETLASIFDGIIVQATLEPRRFPPKRQIRLLDRHLSRLLTD